MTRHTIAFDTICTGFAPITDGDSNPIEFDGEEAALKELESDPEFYDEYFVFPLDEIGHKTIYTGKE